MGSHLRSFHFIVVWDGYLTLSITGGNSPFLNPENVLSPGGTLQRRAEGSPFVFTYASVIYIFCVLEIVFDTFNLQTEVSLFEILEMIYTQKGLCKAEPNRVHLISILLWFIEKGVWHTFILHAEICRYEILILFYPPKRSHTKEGAQSPALLCMPFFFFLVRPVLSFLVWGRFFESPLSAPFFFQQFCLKTVFFRNFSRVFARALFRLFFFFWKRPLFSFFYGWLIFLALF